MKHKPAAERQAEIARRAPDEAHRLALRRLREARDLAQTDLAQTNLAQILNVSRGAISKMERRSDLYISTPRSYLKAMGAELQIKAVFHDGEVLIEQFRDLDEGRDESAA